MVRKTYDAIWHAGLSLPSKPPDTWLADGRCVGNG